VFFGTKVMPKNAQNRHSLVCSKAVTARPAMMAPASVSKTNSLTPAIVVSDFLPQLLHRFCFIGSHPVILQADLHSAAGDSLYFSIQYKYFNQLHK
jgi:hypothetical protein